MFGVMITYQNGKKSYHPFDSFTEARIYYQNHISYSPGTAVRRVEVADVLNNSKRAIWDASWDDESKAAGLRTTP